MEDIECPFCAGSCDVEYVDIGVGRKQVTPAQCRDCMATQDMQGVWHEYEVPEPSILILDISDLSRD